MVAPVESGTACHTTYPGREYLSYLTITALVGVNLLVALTNISLNAFLIYGLFKTKQLGKLSSRLILYLCVSDCCVGALLQPIIMVILIKYDSGINCPIELSAQFIAFLFAQFSGVQIMIIALDRFVRMKFLNLHRKYMTIRRGQFMVIFNLVLSLVLASSSVTAGIYGQFYMFNVILASIDSFVVFMIFGLYTFTYCSVHQHASQARKREKQRSECGQEMKMSKTKARKKPRVDSALAKTMVFILASLGICYIPYLVLGVTWSSKLQLQKGEVLTKSLAALTWWSFMLVHLNSTINALIFATRNAKIMGLLRNMIVSRKIFVSAPTTSERSSSDR